MEQTVSERQHGGNPGPGETHTNQNLCGPLTDSQAVLLNPRYSKWKLVRAADDQTNTLLSYFGPGSHWIQVQR
ncbi:hypothetical protein JOB18_019611 [Solea senegalensis]|uniref:Uncharacterized protein n=1 Tax=Solea senegalensis TaxID=28829 RepID=A0AAV6PZV0_SOLSE|nr:hypothetical protein JOB18_019611 [Solea senegalensis]